MKLRARKSETAQPLVVVREESAPQNDNRQTETIYIRCHAMLYMTMQNSLQAAHTAEDFTYVSVADMVRAALVAYRDGMRLTELPQPGEKISTTVRVTKELKTFYNGLPDRLKSKLIERAIRTFLKGQR